MADGDRERENPEHETVEELLAAARRLLSRLTPKQAAACVGRPDAELIDIRADHQLARDGTVPGAVHIARNVLEWRLDPQSPHRRPDLARRDLLLVVFCDEGYQSSLAAATLTRFGLEATDVIGGFQGWLADGLPVNAPRSALEPDSPRHRPRAPARRRS